MFDSTLRRWYSPYLAHLAAAVHRRGISAMFVSAAGLTLGLAAAASAGLSWWWPALGLWLGSRVVDGLDGAVARLGSPSPVGGFVDIVADFTAYGAFVIGVAAAVPEARLAAVVLLCTYYVSGAAFLAWSAAQKTSQTIGLAIEDDRSVQFVGGFAEGFETIVAYALVCMMPTRAEAIFWVFAALVAVTAVQRIIFAYRDLGETPSRSIDPTE
jgi:phosphatidylglycerophosphate synthase